MREQLASAVELRANLLETVTDAGAVLPRSISTTSSLESVRSILEGCAIKLMY